jgi:hypothetical protein
VNRRAQRSKPVIDPHPAQDGMESQAMLVHGPHLNVGVGMGGFEGLQLSLQIFFPTPAAPPQWRRADAPDEVP